MQEEAKVNPDVMDSIMCIENNNLYNVLSEEIKQNYDITVKIEESESEYETDIIVLDPNFSSPLHGNKQRTTATNQLYEDHIIKEELVIGPEKIQESTNNLKKASKIQEPKRINLHQCSKCEDKHRSRKDLVAHLKAAHDYVVCKLCKKIYSKRSNLKRHQTYFCSKNSSVRENNEKLKYGMFSHAFICDYCKKSYTHKNTLITHMQSHLGGVRKYQCKFCDKDYTKKYNLTCHVQHVHFNVKKYSCKYCKCKYAWRWALRCHEKIHHR